MLSNKKILTGLKSNRLGWVVFLTCGSIVGVILLYLIISLSFCVWQKSQFPNLRNGEFEGTHSYLLSSLTGAIENEVSSFDEPSFLKFDSSKFTLNLNGPVSEEEWQAFTPWALKKTTYIKITKLADWIPGDTDIPKFTHLEDIRSFGWQEFNKYPFSDFESLIFSAGPNLRGLRVEHIRFTQSELERTLNEYPKLFTLGFSANGPIDANFLEGFPNMYFLYAFGDSLGPSHIDSIATHCPELTSLHMAVKGSIADHLSGSTEIHNRLTYLHLFNVSGEKYLKLTEVDIVALRKRFPNLGYIRFDNSELSPGFLKAHFSPPTTGSLK